MRSFWVGLLGLSLVAAGATMWYLQAPVSRNGMQELPSGDAATDDGHPLDLIGIHAGATSAPLHPPAPPRPSAATTPEPDSLTPGQLSKRVATAQMGYWLDPSLDASMKREPPLPPLPPEARPKRPAIDPPEGHRPGRANAFVY